MNRFLDGQMLKQVSPNKPRATAQHGVRIIARLCSWLFILLFFSNCFALEVNIDKIIQIESGGNPNAYNAKSGAIGLMQITKVCLDEFNDWSWKITDSKGRNPHPIKNPPNYNLGNLYNPVINIEIGTWYINTRIPQMLKAYKIPDTIDNRLWAYNAGIGNVRKGIYPKETKNYIKKYHKIEDIK